MYAEELANFSPVAVRCSVSCVMALLILRMYIVSSSVYVCINSVL